MVRYGTGSGFFRTLVTTPHVRGNAVFLIILRMIVATLTHPILSLRALFTRDWARNTMILLYMRSTESTLRFVRKFGMMNTELEQGERPSASMPEATDLALMIAKMTGGIARSMFAEQILNVPTTAHILGGSCMGANAEEGVIDHQHRVFGYEGLYVVDGSAISANVGVNPSLSISALAERAMSFIPKKAEPRAPGAFLFCPRVGAPAFRHLPVGNALVSRQGRNAARELLQFASRRKVEGAAKGAPSRHSPNAKYAYSRIEQSARGSAAGGSVASGRTCNRGARTGSAPSQAANQRRKLVLAPVLDRQ
jgi:hypothetical protein